MTRRQILLSSLFVVVCGCSKAPVLADEAVPEVHPLESRQSAAPSDATAPADSATVAPSSSKDASVEPSPPQRSSSTTPSGSTVSAPADQNNAELEARLKNLRAATANVKCPKHGGGCVGCIPLRQIVAARLGEPESRVQDLIDGIPPDIKCPPPGGGCDGCMPAEDILRARAPIESPRPAVVPRER